MRKWQLWRASPSLDKSTRKRLQEAFDEADEDGSGDIGLNEFISLITPLLGAEAMHDDGFDAAAAAWVFGAVWYGMIGTRWMDAQGLTDQTIDRSNPLPYISYTFCSGRCLSRIQTNTSQRIVFMRSN